MKEKKLTLKYVVNKDIHSPIGREDEYAVYINITYNRQNTRLRSVAFDFMKEEDLIKIPTSAKENEEVRLITEVMALETDNFTASIDKLKWFNDRFKFYLKPINEVYSEYGIKLIAGLLLYGKNVMTVEEQKIMAELRDFLPFTKYLTQKGEYYKKTFKKPHVFISMIYGFIMNQKLKPEYEDLNELKNSIEYYLRGYNCLVDFLESDFIQNKNEFNMLNWILYDLDKKLNDFIKASYTTINEYSALSAKVIEVGLIHSDHYSEIISKRSNLNKLKA